jgi:hypothetical protein
LWWAPHYAESGFMPRCPRGRAERSEVSVVAALASTPYAA